MLRQSGNQTHSIVPELVKAQSQIGHRHCARSESRPCPIWDCALTKSICQCPLALTDGFGQGTLPYRGLTRRCVLSPFFSVFLEELIALPPATITFMCVASLPEVTGPLTPVWKLHSHAPTKARKATKMQVRPFHSLAMDVLMKPT
jgi:hypothetical protein